MREANTTQLQLVEGHCPCTAALAGINNKLSFGSLPVPASSCRRLAGLTAVSDTQQLPPLQSVSRMATCTTPWVTQPKPAAQWNVS